MAYISSAMKANPEALMLAAQSQIKTINMRLKNYAKAAEAYVMDKLAKNEAVVSDWMMLCKSHSELMAEMIALEQVLLQFYGAEYDPANYLATGDPTLFTKSS